MRHARQFLGASGKKNHEPFQGRRCKSGRPNVVSWSATFNQHPPVVVTADLVYPLRPIEFRASTFFFLRHSKHVPQGSRSCSAGTDTMRVKSLCVFLPRNTHITRGSLEGSELQIEELDYVAKNPPT